MKKLVKLACFLISIIVMIIIGSVLSADAALAAGGLSYAINPGIIAMNRDYFERVSAKYSPCAPGYLRVEQTLANSKTRYTFDVKKNQSSDIATERKLDFNDLFAVTHLGIFLSNQSSNTVGKERLNSYPNNAIFNGSGEADYLETLYNGYLDLKVGQTVYIEALSMQHFRFVPTAQKEASNYIDLDQWSIDEMSYWPGSVVYLAGNDNIEINITTPAPSGLDWDHATGSNKIVMFLFGFLCKGSAGKK